jgi:hypothetical protein
MTQPITNFWGRRWPMQLVDPCGRCHLWPCACEYIRRLRPTGDLAHLRQAALKGQGLPFPHRLSCPCPACYAARQRAWEE